MKLSLLELPAENVAPRLLGSLFRLTTPKGMIVGKIVETEAYDQSDAASHSYNGRTPRTDVMFGPAGHLYVYFTYGMHYCCNVVTGPEGHGSGVLIRGMEIMEGLEVAVQNRGGRTGIEVSNGPAKICQALCIDRSWNGHDLAKPPLLLDIQPALPREKVVQTTRIGISQAKDVPWRFYIKDNPYVSRQ